MQHIAGFVTINNESDVYGDPVPTSIEFPMAWEVERFPCYPSFNPNSINGGTTAGFVYRSTVRSPEALEDV